jgi:hypothetical protein
LAAGDDVVHRNRAGETECAIKATQRRTRSSRRAAGS